MKTKIPPSAVFRWTVIVASALLLSKAPVHSAYDIFLKIDGIDGESTVHGRDKWIDILSFSWGVSRPVSTSPGTGSSGRASISDFSITKRTDRASPALFLKAATGNHMGHVVLQVARQGPGDGTAPEPFYEIKLENVVVTRIETKGSGGGDDRPMETISLNFTKIEMGYAVTDPSGDVGDMERVSWDFAANDES